VTTDELNEWVARRGAVQDETEPAPAVVVAQSGTRRGWVVAGILLAVAGTAALWKGPVDDSVRIQQLLLRPDIDGAGSPSWDGRFVPYRNNDAELMLFQTDTGQSLRVLGRPEDVRRNFLNFIASPDGSQIAYMLEKAEGGGELRVLNSDGSGERVLFADPKYTYYNPRSWSRDGRWIAAALWETDDVRAIALIDAKDGSHRVLYRSNTPPTNAQISPDGKYVAYNEKNDVYAVPTAGGAPLGAAVGSPRDTLVGWAPDGRLVFSSDRAGTRDLWGVTLQDGRADEPQLLWKDLNMTPLGITKQGDLYYSRSTLQSDLYAAELQGDGLVSDPVLLPKTRYRGKSRAPDYSRDGKALAYLTNADAGPGLAIRIRTLENGEEREIPIGQTRVDQIRWYPDGTSILVQGGWTKPRMGLYKIWIDRRDQDGKAESEPVVEGMDLHQSLNPTFSPDGSKLYFNFLEGPNRTALIQMDVATGRRSKLVAPSVGVLRLFSLSPDGKRIAYDVGPPGVLRDQLFVRDVAGGEARLLRDAELVRSNGGLIWADDRSLVFHSMDSRGIRVDQLIRVPLDGRPSTPLARTGVVMRMAIHPDGRRVIWEAQTWNMEVSRIQNIFRERNPK
jgi:Tol biopolymer transport system component